MADVPGSLKHALSIDIFCFQMIHIGLYHSQDNLRMRIMGWPAKSGRPVARPDVTERYDAKIVDLRSRKNQGGNRS